MNEASAQTKECPYCGETIKENAQICIHCDKFLYTGRWQRFRWTGFRGKGLWDILSLIIIPLALVLVTIWFSIFQANRQAEVEADRTQETALQAYFDQMTELLLEEKLRESDLGSEMRSIARARTLTVLRRLDPERKGTLLKFLYESKLIIMGTAVIDLSEADLRKADLMGANLREADLRKVDLSFANLREADLTLTSLQRAILIEASLTETELSGASLRRADLSRANLKWADLGGADLTGARLKGGDLGAAFLIGANLEWVNLEGADLEGAHLQGANLQGANLQGANLIRAELQDAHFNGNTTLPDGTKWTPDTDMARFTDPDHPDFWRPDA